MTFKFKMAASVLVLSLAFGGSVRAQGTVPGQYMVPLGYCQVGSSPLGSASKLSANCPIPANATMAVFQAESANVRWRDDGTAPTASVGMLFISGGAPLLYTGTLSEIQIIAATGSPLLDVAFYR
jgi:hypothetical protein